MRLCTQLVVEVELIEGRLLVGLSTGVDLCAVCMSADTSVGSGGCGGGSDGDVVNRGRSPSRALPDQLDEAVGLQLSVETTDLTAVGLPYLLYTVSVVVTVA